MDEVVSVMVLLASSKCFETFFLVPSLYSHQVAIL